MFLKNPFSLKMSMNHAWTQERTAIATKELTQERTIFPSMATKERMLRILLKTKKRMLRFF